jgi:hypothetical protein
MAGKQRATAQVPPLRPGRDLDASDKASKGEPAAPPYNEPRRTGDDHSTTRLYGQHEVLLTISRDDYQGECSCTYHAIGPRPRFFLRMSG